MPAIRLAAVGLFAATAPALAQVTAIDAYDLQLRRFNDFSSTVLNVNNAFPYLQFEESNFVGSGFANQHIGWFASGGSRYEFANDGAFDISVNINLDPGSDTPRKEAGFRFDTFTAGEAFFRVASDGEVAAFGGFLPFYTFGADAYESGTDAVLRMIYRPDDDADPADGDSATMEYIFNGISSGQLAMGNLENGILDGTQGGWFVQASPAVAADGYTATFSDAVFAIPTPGSAGVLAAAGLLMARRRR